MTDRSELMERYARGADAVDAALSGITDAELDHVPDDGGWTARQVAHHLADSETMAYTRYAAHCDEHAAQIRRARSDAASAGD